jgi:hypothetical protein
LGFTVDRSGHVFNREIVTVDQGASRETVRNSGYLELENETTSMIDGASRCRRFPPA